MLQEFPRVTIVESLTKTANGKVGAMIDLVHAAKHGLIVINDSDIAVEPDYLDRVTAPLADARNGLVTCLYRPIGDSFPARFEGLGILTDFAPSVLVARITGVDEFGMGSTLAFRKKELARIGGFAALADYIADDYQLGHRIHSLGLHCVLSDVVVETHMGGDWKHVFEHQLRWARTIRVSRFGGYLGLPVTNATLWALLLAAFGQPLPALALLAIRLLMALAASSALRSTEALRLLPLIPLRDLFGFVIWLAGLFGKRVVWRGLSLELDREGRIVRVLVPRKAVY
jgi:ceramide glucosyltransferase